MAAGPAGQVDHHHWVAEPKVAPPATECLWLSEPQEAASKCVILFCVCDWRQRHHRQQRVIDCQRFCEAPTRSKTSCKRLPFPHHTVMTAAYTTLHSGDKIREARQT